MSLIDRIEFLGQAVDGGLIDRDEAARLLAEYSDGGLTLSGAQRAIDNHKTRRAEYERIYQRSARMLDVLAAVVDARTPEEKFAADAALTAEQDQQLAALREETLRRPRGGAL